MQQNELYLKVVLGESKIRIMKAIHNLHAAGRKLLYVVLGESKIRIMKAIHNIRPSATNCSRVVLGESKIRIMKAIHNKVNSKAIVAVLCSVSQR